MTENPEIILEPDFIHIVSTGKVVSSATTLPEFWTQVPEVARQAGVSKILYEVRQTTGQMGTTQRYTFAARIAEVFRGFQVAFVVPPSLQDAKLFGETVAYNRGGNIRVCTNLADAYVWLEVHPTHPTAGDD